MQSKSANLLHHRAGLLLVHFGVYLSYSRGTVAENYASDVEPEFLTEPGGGIVAELVRVPLWHTGFLARICNCTAVGVSVVSFAR